MRTKHSICPFFTLSHKHCLKSIMMTDDKKKSTSRFCRLYPTSSDSDSKSVFMMNSVVYALHYNLNTWSDFDNFV